MHPCLSDSASVGFNGCAAEIHPSWDTLCLHATYLLYNKQWQDSSRTLIIAVYSVLKKRAVFVKEM